MALLVSRQGNDRHPARRDERRCPHWPDQQRRVVARTVVSWSWTTYIDAGPPEFKRHGSADTGEEARAGFERKLAALAYCCGAQGCRQTNKLARAIRDKSGTVIETREEAKRYVLEMLENRPSSQAWRKAAELLVEEAPAEAIDKQLRFALFMDGALDLQDRDVS